MSTVEQVRRALEQAQRMLARETDPATREFLRAQVQHLEFKLERATRGMYDTNGFEKVGQA